MGFNPAWKLRERLWSRQTFVAAENSPRWVVLHHPRADVEVTKPDVDLTDACPVCASGWRQTGPLHIRPSDLPKRAYAVTAENDVLLREDAVAALEDHGRGLTLMQVMDTKERPLSWYQATPDAELPRVVDASNNGYETDMQCTLCQRDGFFDGNQPPPLYERATLDAIPDDLDFVGSYERLGVSGIGRLAAARVFARRDVAERLRAAAGPSNLILQPLRVRVG